jgi:FKBP-type peptidyl-prolyl cis-trans isomerase SlyD
MWRRNLAVCRRSKRRKGIVTIQAENTRVSLKYTVRLQTGEIVKGDPARGLAHMEFVTGYNQVLPALESKVIGLSEGEELEFSVPPEESFGSYNPSLVQEKTFVEFPQGKELEEGRWVRATNLDHLVSFGYKVVEKRADRLMLDYNHPLAGKTLVYKVRIEKVSEVDKDDLELLKPCQHARP